MKTILLCSDLDRTLIPNGTEPESPQARSIFAHLTAHPKLRLAYVSGRNKRLVEQAIKEFGLPEPDYVIGDVGTTIYRIIGGQWLLSQTWQDEINLGWPGRGGDEIITLLANLETRQFYRQPPENQALHKVSYFTSLSTNPQRLKNKIAGLLGSHGIAANLIWSRDDYEQRGLLDILPQRANKLLAIRFLMIEKELDSLRTVFAGDSGNDLDALTSGLPSILVKNAAPDIGQAALDKLTQMDLKDRLYMAKGDFMEMNGNYASGVIEGLVHFFPDTAKWLKYA